MKKLFYAMVLALVMLFIASALAEGIVLPDPAFYFNQACENNIIEFDAYPKAEYDAYVSLLQEAYGMEVVEEDVSTSYELAYLEAPGVENSRTLVGCFTNSKGSGMEFDFGEGVALSALDVFISQLSSDDWAHIATEGGTVITAPSIFMGYDVPLKNIEDYTHQDPPHMNYLYDFTSTEDLVRYIEEIDASPYFELVEVETSKYIDRQAYHFCYTGNEPSVEVSDRNLTISVRYPKNDTSTFYIYEYPSFTVSYEADPNPAPDPNSDEKQRCVFCDKGRCKKCGGGGFVYEYASYEKDWREKKDCSSCIAGRCTHCDGTGWR